MIRVAYLLGAGRSGTTLLAAVLHAHPQIHTLGEMHQFLGFLKDNRNCSCEKELSGCPFWGRVLENQEIKDLSTEKLIKLADKMEGHSNILSLLLGRKPQADYQESQRQILNACQMAAGSPVLLDASKYIGRFLMLNKDPQLKLRGIFMTRDVRGVVDSFGKNVQTPKPPVASLVYYGLINTFGELVFRLFPNVVKIRYEDLIRNPQSEVLKIFKHLEVDTPSGFVLPNEFDMPHIVGGNRLKSQSSLAISANETWKNRMPRWRQLAYYAAVWPLMLLNGYKP